MRALRKRYRGGSGTNTRAVAFHEAGHIVVAEHLGLCVRSMTWRPKREITFEPSATDDRLVHAMRSKTLDPIDRPTAQAHLLCALAGREAEAMALGQSARHPWDAKDIRALQMLLREPLSGYEVEAHQMLVEHWPEVTAVAAEIAASHAGAIQGARLRQAMYR